MIEISKLEDELEKLTGNDIEQVEKESRKLGNTSAIITTSSDFQSRLAARALKCNVHDLRSLPAKKYTYVLNTVIRFLYSYTDEMEVDDQQTT